MQAVVNNGIKVDEKGITCLTEMLMRQLLKLDGIEADGEGRAQRRAEVSVLINLHLLLSLHPAATKKATHWLLFLNVHMCPHCVSIYLARIVQKVSQTHLILLSSSPLFTPFQPIDPLRHLPFTLYQ